MMYYVNTKACAYKFVPRPFPSIARRNRLAAPQAQVSPRVEPSRNRSTPAHDPRKIIRICAALWLRFLALFLPALVRRRRTESTTHWVPAPAPPLTAPASPSRQMGCANIGPPPVIA